MPFTIEARALSSEQNAHNFLVLRDENGQAVAEMHGLTTNRGGPPYEVSPINVTDATHSLRVWQFLHDSDYRTDIQNYATRGDFTTPDMLRGMGIPATDPASGYSYIKEGTQDSREIFSGSRDEALNRWNAAANAITDLNARDQSYAVTEVEASAIVNGNSAYRTFSELMGLPVHEFSQYAQPGVNSRLLSEADILVRKHPDMSVLATFSGPEQRLSTLQADEVQRQAAELAEQQRQAVARQEQAAQEDEAQKKPQSDDTRDTEEKDFRDQLSDKQRTAFDQLSAHLNPKLQQMGYSPAECDNIKAGCMQAMQKMGVSEVKFAGITSEGRVVIGSESQYYTPSCLADSYNQVPAEQTINAVSQAQDLAVQNPHRHDHPPVPGL